MIYKLRAERSSFLNFDIDAYEIELTLGDYFLLHQPRWADFWKPLPATFYEDSDDGNAVKIPDITVWGTYVCLALNDSAYQTLNADLSSYGEFLPATCEGNQYQVFHVTKKLGIDIVNQEKSSRVQEVDGYINLKSLHFEEDKLSDELIFLTEYDGFRNIYCTEKFKALTESHSLHGLRFSMDLVSIYEP